MTNIRRTRLAGGLDLLTCARRAAPVAAVTLWYRVGSRDEGAGSTGLAHFLEHMMFKGSGDMGKGAIDRLTQRSGGSNNAFTCCDATAYHFELPAAHVGIALRIEADRMRGLLLDGAELEAERAVILEEIAQAEDEPEARVQTAVDRLLFGDHGYGHPVLGWRADIESCTVEGMRAFYDRWYGPGSAALVVAGDIDEGQVIASAEALFPSGGGAGDRDLTAPGPLGAERRATLREDVVVPRVAVAFRAPDTLDPRADALDLLARILATGRSSRLFRRLVEADRLLSQVRASNNARACGGSFQIDGEGRPAADPGRIEEALFDELGRVAASGVTPHEVRRAKNGVLSETLFRAETAATLAEDIGDAVANSTLEEFLTYTDRIEAVTADEIQAACEAFCRRADAVAVWSVPK